MGTTPPALPIIERIYRALRSLPMAHPQWLSNRYHRAKLSRLQPLRSCTVLDIGSGGLNLRDILHESNRLWRLDHPKTLAYFAEAPDVYGDAQALPFPSNCMDAVVLFEVLEHIPDHERAVTEIARVLKTGGRLFLSAPFIYPTHDAPFDFFRFTRFGLRRLLEKNGMRPRVEVPLGNGFVVALQLFNLALLESVRTVLMRHRALGFFLMLAAYPVCLLSNVFASFFLGASFASSGCFGYFIEAERI